MKIRAVLVCTVLLVASCAGTGQVATTAESRPDLEIVDPADQNSDQSLPPTTQTPTTQNGSSGTGICGAVDAYFDRLFADSGAPLDSEGHIGEDIFDPQHPIAKMDDGPFGEAWSSLMADLSSREPSEDHPLIESERALLEIDDLSIQQCGYPVFATQAAVVFSCSSTANGVEKCYASGDPRIGYQEFQTSLRRIDSYFDAGGVDWISELPGAEVARRDRSSGHSVVILRVNEDQIPEIGLWIAEFLETNEFYLDDSDLGELRGPLFWGQAQHRSTFLSIAVVGGLFGDYTYPENPDGTTINVRSLASPSLNSSRGDESQDLYLIRSEFSNSLLSDEEILPIYETLAPDESLLLISIQP